VAEDRARVSSGRRRSSSAQSPLERRGEVNTGIHADSWTRGRRSRSRKDSLRASAERLHKAAKAARRVALYTHTDAALLRREALSRPIHRVEEIEVWPLELPLIDALAETLGRTTKLELVRSDERLYVTFDGRVVESPLSPIRLV
jgi:YaeQ protein